MAKKPTVDEQVEPEKYHQEELLKPDPRDYMTAATFHEETGEQVNSSVGQDGKEYPDPVPMAPPIDYIPPPDLMTMIRTMIHHERFQQLAKEEGWETPDEADDFEIDDDPLDPLTPYERHFLPPDEAEPSPPHNPPGSQQPSPQATPLPPAGVSSPPPASEPPAGPSAEGANPTPPPPPKQVRPT